jgi:hypothetical protein
MLKKRAIIVEPIVETIVESVVEIIPIVKIKIPSIVESVVEIIPIVEIAQQRKIVRQQIDGVLTGLWFYVKVRAVETVEETVEIAE